jgi:hypothetical protein
VELGGDPALVSRSDSLDHWLEADDESKGLIEVGRRYFSGDG